MESSLPPTHLPRFEKVVRKMKELVTYESPGIETTIEPQNRLSKRQILFMLAFPLLFLLCVNLTRTITGVLGPVVSANLLYSTSIGFGVGILVFIILIPKVLRIPNGTMSLREYLTTIGVDRIRPLSRTFLIFIPCFIIIMVSQVIASLVYNQFILGWEFGHFTNQLFNSHRIGNKIGYSVLYSFGCIFEEVVLRGVILTMLLKFYSKRTAIFGSALLFGYGHLLNLLNGPLTYELVVFVSAQVIWTTIHGVLYGHMFLLTGNLYSNMILHLSVNGMGNCFMYLPYVTPEIHAVLNIVFNIGLVSTLLSLGWIILVNKYWPLKKKNEKAFSNDWTIACLLERFPF
jgi:membrane protease YdiL (CAAX protease family)